MSTARRTTAVAALVAVVALLTLVATGAVAAPTPADPVPGGGVDAGSMVAPLVRMVLSLGAVLALVAGLAWVAQRLRAGGRLKSGLIEVVSGISLGAREKVVLLRVGQEQVLVGVSPSGMRTLHVIKDAAGAAPFQSYMERTP